MSGRNILEEDLVQEIVLHFHPNVILLPGQTVPLTLFRTNEVSAMKRLIETTKTFGLVPREYLAYFYAGNVGKPTVPPIVGTTAEIYEFRDPPEDSNEVGLKLKIKGRQRFRVLSSRTQADGVRLGSVEILRERELPEPMMDIRLRTRDRLRPYNPAIYDHGEAESEAASSTSKPIKRK